MAAVNVGNLEGIIFGKHCCVDIIFPLFVTAQDSNLQY